MTIRDPHCTFRWKSFSKWSQIPKSFKIVHILTLNQFFNRFQALRKIRTSRNRNNKPANYLFHCSLEKSHWKMPQKCIKKAWSHFFTTLLCLLYIFEPGSQTPINFKTNSHLVRFYNEQFVVCGQKCYICAIFQCFRVFENLIISETNYFFWFWTLFDRISFFSSEAFVCIRLVKMFLYSPKNFLKVLWNFIVPNWNWT